MNPLTNSNGNSFATISNGLSTPPIVPSSTDPLKKEEFTLGQEELSNPFSFVRKTRPVLKAISATTAFAEGAKKYLKEFYEDFTHDTL